MNKVMLYVGLAILLGTVTMVAPLALLSQKDTVPNDKILVTTPDYEVMVPESTKPSDEENFFTEDRTLEAGNNSVQTTIPEAAPSIPMEPSETVPEPDSIPEEPELLVRTAENSTNLYSVGFMVVPSFFVALGVFIYLRKRIS